MLIAVSMGGNLLWHLIAWCYLNSKRKNNNGQLPRPVPCACKFFAPLTVTAMYDGCGCSFFGALMLGWMYTCCCWVPQGGNVPVAPAAAGGVQLMPVVAGIPVQPQQVQQVSVVQPMTVVQPIVQPVVGTVVTPASPAVTVVQPVGVQQAQPVSPPGMVVVQPMATQVAAQPAAAAQASCKFCPSCGAQIVNNAKFCAQCGTPTGN